MKERFRVLGFGFWGRGGGEGSGRGEDGEVGGLRFDPSSTLKPKP